MASYRFRPGSDLPILIKPIFDAGIPIDAVRMRFFRYGVELGSCYHQVKSLATGVTELLTIPGSYLPAGGPIQLQVEVLSGGQQAGCDPNHLPILSGGITLSPTGITVVGLIGLASITDGCEDAIISPIDGSTNVRFQPQVDGGPFAYEWRWSRSEGGQTYYWTGSGWTLPTNSELLFQSVTGAGANFWSRWTLSNGTIQPKAGVAEPFSGLTTSFFRFGTPITERDRLDTRIELRITGTTQTVDTTVSWYKRATCTPGPAAQKVKQLWVSLDLASTPQPAWVYGVSYPSGDANRLRLRVDSDDTTNQATGFAQYWARVRNSQGTQLRCERVTTEYTVSYIAGAGTYELAPNHASLLSLLNQEGAKTLELVPDPAASCPSGDVDDRFRVSLTVNPIPVQTPRLRVKLHYRDHLGSSWVTKTFRPATGQTRALDGGAITLQTTVGALVLTGEAPEFHSYEPFGEPLDGGNDRARYTDHEYDGESGLHYMKGRFQLATATKFNRPDPMRDWDWTNPSSINLYQYVRNDPINAHDPTGYGHRWYNFVHGTDLTKDEYKELKAAGLLDAAKQARSQSEFSGEVDGEVATYVSYEYDGLYVGPAPTHASSGINPSGIYIFLYTTPEGIYYDEKDLPNASGHFYYGHVNDPMASGTVNPVLSPAEGLFFGGLAQLGSASSAARKVAINGVKGNITKPGPKLLHPGKWTPGDFAEGSLGRHFAKHGKEWGIGNITELAYQKRAKSLLGHDVGGNVLGFTGKQGWVFRYNKRTNELAIAKPNGTIETLFRPKKGLEYYLRQVEKYGP